MAKSDKKGMFSFIPGRKHSDGEGESVTASSKKVERTKRREETLTSVVDESVPSAVVQEMRENTDFMFVDGNKAAILLLDVESIGGLSKKTNKDETKGSVVQSIRQHKIATVAFKEMLDFDILGLIPNPETLSRMGEYSLLADATYHWGLADLSDPENVDIRRGPSVSYDKVMEVSDGDMAITDILGDNGEVITEAADKAEAKAKAEEASETTVVPAQDKDASPASDEAATEAETTAQVQHDASGLSEEPDLGDEAVDEESADETPDEAAKEPEGTEGTDDPEGYAEEPDEGSVDLAALAADGDELVVGDGEIDDDDDGDLRDEEPQMLSVDTDPADDDEPDGYLTVSGEVWQAPEDGEVTTEAVQSSIARQYLSDGVALEIDMATFDEFFAVEHTAETFTFDTEEGSWLGDQVQTLAQQANSEIAALHQEHIGELRRVYVQLLSMAMDRIINDTSIHDKSTAFGQAKAAMDAQLEVNRGELESKVRIEQDRIIAVFKAEEDLRADAAAQQARARYQEVNGARKNRELADAESQMSAAFQSRYNQALGDLQSKRATLATSQYNAEVSATLEELNRQFEPMLAQQREQREQWSKAISTFIDENRKNDIAHDEALAEQLRQSTELARVREEEAANREKLLAENKRAMQNSQARAEAQLQDVKHAAQMREAELKAAVEKANDLANQAREESRANRELAAKAMEDQARAAEIADAQARNKYDDLLQKKDHQYTELERSAEQKRQMDASALRTMLMILIPLMVVVALVTGLITGLIFYNLGTEADAAMMLSDQMLSQLHL